MCEDNMSLHRKAILIRMIVLMHEAEPNVWNDVVDIPFEGRGADWAHTALTCIEKLREKLRVSPNDHKRWNDLAAECPEAQSYYQLDDLAEALAIMSGEFENEGGWDSEGGANGNENGGGDNDVGGGGGGGYSGAGDFSAGGYGLIPGQFQGQTIKPGTILGAVGGVVLTQQGTATGTTGTGTAGGRQQADIAARGVHDDEDLVAEIKLGDSEESGEKNGQGGVDNRGGAAGENR